jgi:hypothetical protein
MRTVTDSRRLRQSRQSLVRVGAATNPKGEAFARVAARQNLGRPEPGLEQANGRRGGGLVLSARSEFAQELRDRRQRRRELRRTPGRQIRRDARLCPRCASGARRGSAAFRGQAHSKGRRRIRRRLPARRQRRNARRLHRSHRQARSQARGRHHPSRDVRRGCAMPWTRLNP